MEDLFGLCINCSNRSTARTWFMIQLCPHIFFGEKILRLDLGLFKVICLCFFYQDKSQILTTIWEHIFGTVSKHRTSKFKSIWTGKNWGSLGGRGGRFPSRGGWKFQGKFSAAKLVCNHPGCSFVWKGAGTTPPNKIYRQQTAGIC